MYVAHHHKNKTISILIHKKSKLITLNSTNLNPNI